MYKGKKGKVKGKSRRCVKKKSVFDNTFICGPYGRDTSVTWTGLYRFRVEDKTTLGGYL